MKGFLIFTFTGTSFATTNYSFEFFSSGPQIIQIRPINYSLHFESVKIHKHCVYIRWYLVLTYMERLLSTVCWLFSHICLSVNCISWVSKFNNFFLTCLETEARFIFEGFIVLYGKLISKSSIFFLLFLSGI